MFFVQPFGNYLEISSQVRKKCWYCVCQWNLKVDFLINNCNKNVNEDSLIFLLVVKERKKRKGEVRERKWQLSVISSMLRQWWSKLWKLRYYATFKVRKSELLFYKINIFFAKSYHLHWIAGRANILSKYIFFSFVRGFCGSFLKLFSKAPASCCKQILN